MLVSTESSPSAFVANCMGIYQANGSLASAKLAGVRWPQSGE